MSKKGTKQNPLTLSEYELLVKEHFYMSFIISRRSYRPNKANGDDRSIIDILMDLGFQRNPQVFESDYSFNETSNNNGNTETSN